MTSCRKAVAGNEIFQPLNAVGAPQKTIDAAVAFDEKQDGYDLIERGLPFARADALMQHPAVAAIQPFNPLSPSRIAHAALVEIKTRCGLWGHTGLPIANVLSWIALTYGLDGKKCREALILGANKRGLHIDDGPNEHIYLADHFKAERRIFRVGQILAKMRLKVKKAAPKSARIMVGMDGERLVHFADEQRECLRGLIECAFCGLTGGPGSGKTTVLTALNDYFEDMLIVALAAKAGIHASTVTGARHSTIAGIIEMADLLDAAMENGVHRIVFCGDPDQLAAISNGSPFIDLIKSGKVPVFRLTENHRTDSASLGIAEFCAEINNGGSE